MKTQELFEEIKKYRVTIDLKFPDLEFDEQLPAARQVAELLANQTDGMVEHVDRSDFFGEDIILIILSFDIKEKAEKMYKAIRRVSRGKLRYEVIDIDLR